MSDTEKAMAKLAEIQGYHRGSRLVMDAFGANLGKLSNSFQETTKAISSYVDIVERLQKGATDE